jgi:hypothetical protein
MSLQDAVDAESTTRASAPSVQAGYYDDDDRGYRWVAFASVLLLMLGTLNFIAGIAPISNSRFFVANTHYVFGSLNTWGWVILLVGIVELCIGFCVYAKSQFSRSVGARSVGVNAITQLLMIPADRSDRCRSSRSTSWLSTGWSRMARTSWGAPEEAVEAVARDKRWRD